MLSTIEGEVLGTRFIRELLSLVDSAPDDMTWLIADRDRLHTKRDRLIASIAAGVPAESVAAIRERETQIRDLEKQINRPRVPRLDHTRLLAALEQRAAEWKAELRAEPQVARMALRRLVGPLTLWDEAVVGAKPDFIEWSAEPKTDLLAGLAPT